MNTNRYPFMRRFLSVLTIVVFLFCSVLPVFAASSDEATSVRLTEGSSKMLVNGTALTIEKPYRSGKILYVPLRSVLEAFGADVLSKAGGKITVIYRDTTAELAAGNATILLNNAKVQLPAPPVVKNKVTMVPVEFVGKCMGTGFSAVTSGKDTLLKLSSDGALKDLSFLIGSIAQTKAGNSYFGWSMSIPKGSRIGSETFNSKYVDIENDQRGLAIEVYVEGTEGKTLSEFYKTNLEDAQKSYDESLIDSALFEKGTYLPYAEFLYAGQYDEAIYQRVYASGKYFYYVTMTSIDETDPNVLKEEKYYKTLMDSFKLGYNGTAKDVSNLSKISSSGFAEFTEYLNSEAAAKKLTGWTMDFPPEWDDISTSSNPYSAMIGTDVSKYVSVDIKALADGENVKQYGDSIKKNYEDNFNPDYYKLLDSGTVEDEDFDSYMLSYEVKMGKKQFRYEERFIEDSGFVYDITFKTAADQYSADKQRFVKMLQSFTPMIDDEKSVKEDITKFEFNNDKNRISKDDTVAKYTAKSGTWNMDIAGYWQQKSYPSQNIETFSNADNGAAIMVEAVENKSNAVVVADEEKFSIMKSMLTAGIKLTRTETASGKGMNVKVYTYRLEDDENEDYADVVFRVFDKGSYSYCYMSTIQDFCASKKNLAELDAIWNSFTPMEPTSSGK